MKACALLAFVAVMTTTILVIMTATRSLERGLFAYPVTTNRAALEPTGGAFPASYYSRLHPPLELVLSGESVMQILVSCAMLSPKKAEMLFAW